MTHIERYNAIMNYQTPDRMPVLHFGYWSDVVSKWVREGHITDEEANGCWDGSEKETAISSRLGFDYNYFNVAFPKSGMSSLSYLFEPKSMGKTPDGFDLFLNSIGCVEMHREGAGSIPAEVDHILKDRESWEKEYLPRMIYSKESYINTDALNHLKSLQNEREIPLGIYCGSMYGDLRNFMGVENISYLYADDEDLFAEMLNHVGNLWFNIVRDTLETGLKFEFAHFWEDICFKNGPLVAPDVFREYCLPQYEKICALVKSYGINNISLDCDGLIDSLIPIWIDGGINTMFPIEVGTWDANIAPWREKYGKTIKGVGGMRKHVFEGDYSDVDKEIERLKPLIALGGYIPCPDHRIPPESKWETIQYYCDKMKNLKI